MASSLPPDMSQLVLYDKSHDLADQSTISRLEALPQELRMEILRYVLHTKYARLDWHVRHTEGENISHARAFDWTIGVLRTCKTLHSDGVQVLNKENQWIKIIMRMDRDFSRMSLLNHDVHFVEPHVNSSLKNHIAVVEVGSQRPQWTSQWKSSATKILIPLEEVQSFCWYLRAMDLPNFIWYKFKFELTTKLSKSIQRQILQPFTTITGEAGAQQIEFAGPIDGALTKKLTSAMTQQVSWLRAKAWDMYHCTEHIKAVGDEAFLKGEFNVAVHKYRQVFSFWDASVANHSMVKHVDDVLDATFKRLDMACVVNLHLADIFAGEVESAAAKEKYEFKDLNPSLRVFSSIDATPPFAALGLFIAGIFLLVQRRLRLAQHAFQLTASNGTPKEKTQAQRALTITRSYGMSSEFDRKADLEELISFLPRVPLASPSLQPYICPYAALEKHLCRQLGFSGPFTAEATNLIIEGISICSVIYGGIERMSSETHIGLGLRFVSKNLKLFPTEGRGSYSQEDINILEMLLTKRLEAQWRLAGRRGRKPAIAQCGQVGEGLPQLLETYKTQLRLSNEMASRKVPGTAGLRCFPKIDNDTVTFNSLKEEQYEDLEHLWESFIQSRRAKLERVVQEMFDVYHRK